MLVFKNVKIILSLEPHLSLTILLLTLIWVTNLELPEIIVGIILRMQNTKRSNRTQVRALHSFQQEV